MRKKLRSLLVAMFALTALILILPGFGSKAVYAKSKKPKLTPKTATLTVGDTLKLKMKYAKPVKYSIQKSKYATVDGNGVVTAKKAYSKAVTVRVECDNGKVYKCKIKIVKPQTDANPVVTDGDNGSTTEDPEPEQEEAPSVIEPITVTSTEELSKAGWFGWYSPVAKTKYKSEYKYDGVITSEEELINFAKMAMENGAEKFTFKYKGNFYANNDPSCWWDRFNAMTCQYSILGGYGNQYSAEFSGTTNGTASISVLYKEAWKAVTYLKHYDYKPTDTAKKIADKCTKLVDEAIAICGEDKRAVLLHINNALCDMAEYDYDALNAVINYDDANYSIDSAHDATGVLFDGKGVCESYTAAFRVCLEILGVDNYCVNNKSTVPGSMDGHVWNYVEQDGAWYHVDVTWNDGWDNAYFMLTSSELDSRKYSDGDYKSHDFYSDYLPK